ncbi:Uncharacterised protein [Kluyvera cryocrescens]|uniref:Uncharacterized protein n=1 Tax=Kluyvera cryocrescens TaxID=580 RepID=A0A485BBX2_KLUCR|nr:Uncharacterised protein [Kluyvera cryocrescens]
MAHGQQFFNRVNYRDAVATRAQQSRHDSDRELLTAADKTSIDAVRALSQQADAVQDMFNLGKFEVNGGFQFSVRETWLGVGEPGKQFSKDTFGVGNIGQRILPANGFFNHRHQMVGDFCRGREHGCYLPLPGVAFQDIGYAQKPFRVCH